MSWIQPPKYPDWSFSRLQPHLVKVVIDLRTSRPTPSTAAPRDAGLGNLRERFDYSSQFNIHLAKRHSGTSDESKRPQSAGTGATTTGRVFDENNVPWIQGRSVQHLGDELDKKDRYFGGPIYNRHNFLWCPTFFTRASGEVHDADEHGIPIPPNMGSIVRSVAVMKSRYMTQSALWVGPRLLISTLHLYHWQLGEPTTEECELVRKAGHAFEVESEITAQILTDTSPKVQLIAFDIDADIGVFRLMDKYRPSPNHIDPDWLVETNRVRDINLTIGRKVACLGYNGQIDATDAEAVKAEANKVVQDKFGPLSRAVPLDVNSVLKPQMKSFSPGTIDKGEARPTMVKLGVSASVWKGGSGGPCVLLDGIEAGKIIGLVNDHLAISDPVNVINALPNGLKRILSNLGSETPVLL